MNKLYVGFNRDIELPKGGFLFIDDEVPKLPKTKTFDPLTHSFNPLQKLSVKRAREIAEILYTVSSQGENTLTVRNGRRALRDAFSRSTRLDRLRFGRDVSEDARDEAQAMVDDLLASPVLSRVLCRPPNFLFNPVSRIFARINRAELGEFDALVLGLFLIGHFKGQVIVPDFGFYGREAHSSLIREGRLIAGVNFLGELSPNLRRSVLLIKDKAAAGATVEDAEALALYARLKPGTNGFDDFVREATA